jgi:hypothetical protein
MARKEIGIRGVDGSQLARMRGIIKEQYGKTKDIDGSITARVINGLIFSWIETNTDKTAATRKKRTTIILEAIIDKLTEKTMPVDDVIKTIQHESGTDDLRSTVKYVMLLERAGIYNTQQRERIINKAYSLYRVTRKKTTNNINAGLTVVHADQKRDRDLFEAMQAQIEARK